MAGITLASITDVLPAVFGVVFALCGGGVFGSGLVALADRRWRPGSAASLGGLLVVAVGLWLVGAFG